MALVGKSNEEKIWNFFKSKGLNDYACAGLVGNAYAESGLRSNNLEDTYQKKLGMTDEEYTNAVDSGAYDNFVYDSAGYGIFQFTYWSLKKGVLDHARATNRSIGNLEMQLEYAWSLFQKSYASMLNILKTAKSVMEASNAVLLKFERPADQSISMQNRRASYGQNYYNKFAKDGNKEGENHVGYKTCTKGSAVKLSKNFNSNEFDCHGSGCCHKTLINETLVEYLQKIREHFGKPITITSGYRCDVHNKNIGGATGSRHSKGDAADIVVTGVAPKEVAKYAESIGVKGIGLYETSADGYFVHIDARNYKSFWYGQAQSPRSTFGGTKVSSSTSNCDNKINTIKEVQQWLIRSYNANISDDGIYGPKTKAALIKVLQKALGVNDDGIYGKETKSAVKTLSIGSSGEEVKALQGLLVCNGYTSVNVDGKYGSKTSDAVRSYQGSKDLTRDGKAGKDTFSALCE